MKTKTKKAPVRRGRPRIDRVGWSGPRVYELLGRAGMTVADLARAAGVATSTVYKWQSPKSRGYTPSRDQGLAVVAALAKALGERLSLADVAPRPKGASGAKRSR